MADDEVTPLTTTTTNYGWTKPNVGASDDIWGGQLNADLDSIDATVHAIDTRAMSAITAGSTPTSGFETGQVLMSDGTHVKAMTYGVTMNFGSAAAPLMVSSENGTPGLLTFTGQQSGYPTAFGVALHLPGAFPGAGGFGVSVSAFGYFGLNNLSNWMNGLPDFAMVSDANEAGRGDFRSISNPAQPLDLRVYNTYSSSTVGEWGGFDWKTVPNTLTIGANAAGGGVLRPVNIVGSTVTVNGSPIPAASSSSPLMDGTAAAGTGTTFARADHVHPTDTSRYAASNPAGYQTAAQVTASLANYLPLSGGTVTGPINAAGGLTMTGTLPSLIWHYTDNSLLGQIGYQGTSTMGWNNAAASTWLYLWNDSSFSFFGGTGIAVKTGGGSWTAASDARIKTVEGAWTLGLAEVLQLEPVVYRYRGNDAEPGKTSAHAQVARTGQAFVGLIAQAVETVFPNMVTQGKGWIDGAEVNDFRNLDPSSLIYTLINAVKTLAAEVNALKGAREGNEPTPYTPPPTEG